MAKYEYKTIDTRSLKGLKEAERMADKGWYIIASGFSRITFERVVKKTSVVK